MYRAKLTYFLLCGLLVLVLAARLQSYRPIHDLYNADHLNALMLSTAGISTVQYPTILVFYKPSCRKELEKHGLSNVPPVQVTYTVYHDWETFPRYTWFESPSDEKPLHEKFGISSCLTALFFKRGATPDQPSSTWTPECGQHFVDWAWSHFRFSMLFDNKHSNPVRVQIGPHFHMDIQPGSQQSVNTFERHEVTISDLTNQEQIGYHILDGTRHKLEITRVQDSLEEDEDIMDVMIEVKLADQEVEMNRTVRMTRHAHRELLNVKQPLLVRSFTKTGYEVAKIPDAAVAMLRDLYSDPKKQTDESCEELATLVNHVGLPCIWRAIPEETAKKVANLIAPALKEWSKTPLVFTNTDGMMEFVAGNNVFSHVGNPQDQVISAILHVQHDLDDTPNWPLEVIDPTGVKREVTLEPGQMLMVESARLIKGRSTPFIGNNYVDATFHFKPLAGWPYTRQTDIDRLNSAGDTRDGNTLVGAAGVNIPLYPLDATPDFWRKAKPDLFIIRKTIQLPVPDKDEL